MSQRRSVNRQSIRTGGQTPESMSPAERLRLAAFVAAGALAMGVVGLLADRSQGILGTIGLVLMVFAVIGVAQAAAIAWGFLTPGERAPGADDN